MKSRAVEAGLGVGLIALAAWMFGGEASTGAKREPAPGRPDGPERNVGDGEAPRSLDAIAPAASYTLTAVLDPDLHTIHGSGVIRFVNQSNAALDHLYVHLYLNAFANEDTVFRRQRAGGFRGTTILDAPGSIRVDRFFAKELGTELFPSSPETEGDPRDATDIRVPLPRLLAPGEALEIETEFTSTLPSIALRTGFAGTFHMAGQWFPKLAKLEPDGTFAHFPFERFSEFYADFGDYDVTIDVPDTYVVGASGVLVDDTLRAGRRVVRYRQTAIHDFAFTAWDRFVERSVTAKGVVVRSLAPPGFERAQEREIDAATRGLDELGRRFGAYPYPTLTIVHPPSFAAEAGGMEYPTLITTGGAAWLADAPVRALEIVTLHELSHQWFYGLVATNENRWPFLDEGVTSWATGEAAHALYGSYETTPWVPLEIGAVERASAARVFSHAPIASPAQGFVTGTDYGALVYARTATVLRTIDRVWDGAAGRAVERYARGGRFGHPGPDALERAIEVEGGAPARAFFHAAVFERGWVDFEAVTASSRLVPGEGYASEIVVRRGGTLVVPVGVEATHEDGTVSRLAWSGEGDAHRFELFGDSKVVSFQIDPEQRVLLDENKLNDGWSSAPSGSAPRTRTLATFLAFAGLSSVLP